MGSFVQSGADMSFVIRTDENATGADPTTIWEEKWAGTGSLV